MQLGHLTDDYLRRTSHRQHLTWLCFLRDELDRPSRSDYYAMQTALVVMMTQAKDCPVRSVNELKIPFEAVGDEDDRPPDPEEIAHAAAISRGRWCAAVGMTKAG